MNTITNWIIAISNIFVALFAGIALWQLYLYKTQSKKDQEKSRREKAIDLLMHFDQHLDQETSMARKLIERLSDDEIQNIFDQEPFSIKCKYKNLAEGALRGRYELENNSGMIDFDERQSSEIRWLAIKYLNLLETALSAWHNNVADQDIIKSQFKYIYDPRNGEKAMSNFRRIAGGKETFPAIDAFIKHLSEEYNKSAKGKDQI